ncbi:MAG: lipoprotein-releasing ABC transporter permease subunit LolC [Sodalis sp. (in: enterobacteria)]
MYQPVILYISLRYMRRQGSDGFGRFVSWFSTIAITFGVMAMVVVLSVMNGLERELESNILGLMPHVLLTTSERRLDPKRIPASVPEALAGITRVAPLSTGDVVLQSARSLAVGVMIGVNPGDFEPLSHHMQEAWQDDLLTGQYRVILGNKLAAVLGVKRGDVLRLMVPWASQFTPMGRIPSQRIFTVVGTFSANSEVDSYQLLVNQQDAVRLMRYPAGYVTGWRLWLEQPLAVDRLSMQSLPDGLVWHDWRERKGQLFEAVRMEKNMIGLLLSLIVAVAAFNVISLLGLQVMEKQREVAILQTQGLNRRQVMLMFIAQGASASIIGVLLGAGIGIFLASQLSRLKSAFGALLDGSALPVAIIEPVQVAVITLSAMAVALLSTIYPSWRAAAAHPAEALQYE